MELCARSSKLINYCFMGIKTMMSKAVVESHKAFQQAEDTKKLTFPALFFVPLSFVSSVSGMDFRVLVRCSLGIWCLFVVAIPVTALSQYIWVSQT